MSRVTPFCMRCGERGPDVRMVVVDLEAEARAIGTTVPRVEVVQEIALRYVTERVTHVVPERFGAEWRCRDREACDRWHAVANPMPSVATGPAVDEPAPQEEPTVPSWWES